MNPVSQVVKLVEFLKTPKTTPEEPPMAMIVAMSRYHIMSPHMSPPHGRETGLRGVSTATHSGICLLGVSICGSSPVCNRSVDWSLSVLNSVVAL